jgi:D-alanyl-D-alanine dipeptidase
MKQLLLLCLLLGSLEVSTQNLPKGFSYLSDIDATIQKELRYITSHNFIGKPIDGYEKDTLIISTKAAKALQKVQTKLRAFGLSLKVFDAYRPQLSVNHFVRWAKVLNDTLMKQQYYPDVAKKDLFKLDYIASRSGHTRGSTVDVTIVDIKTGKELDMGSSFDFFGRPSHPFYPNLTRKQRANRLLLRNLMLEAGFKPYSKEWWHFTLKDEPFPKTYFNFPIK